MNADRYEFLKTSYTRQTEETSAECTKGT